MVSFCVGISGSDLDSVAIKISGSDLDFVDLTVPVDTI